MKETQIDVVKMAEQILEAKVNNDLLEAAEKESELAYAFVKLLNEYGIYGSRACSFIQKVDAINNVIKAIDEPEEE